MSEELFSYRVRRFREDHHLRQDELASVLGVTARYISMIESGQKEVEPSSSLYKLFALLEANKVPIPEDAFKSRMRHSDGSQVREDAMPYRVNGKNAGVSARDAMDQVRADLQTLETGTAAEKRRTLNFMREVHLPLLIKALNLE